jgi:hypothetical protein
VDFTREPIIETVVTAKEGSKLVVRSSKTVGQEEYFVDAVEVISFGNAFFFRSLERPKCFLVPVSDYEVVEVREARMILKHSGSDRNSIKINSSKSQREPAHAKAEPATQTADKAADKTTDETSEKKRERRRPHRRRRGREEKENPAGAPLSSELSSPTEEQAKDSDAQTEVKESRPQRERPEPTSEAPQLLAPPPSLISETISRYKDNEQFKSVFFEDKVEDMESTDSSPEIAEEELKLECTAVAEEATVAEETTVAEEAAAAEETTEVEEVVAEVPEASEEAHALSFPFFSRAKLTSSEEESDAVSKVSDDASENNPS